MHNFLEPGKASVLLDGQFGSTGKGLAAAYLHRQIGDHVNWDEVICTTNAAPNAGHTTVTAEGRRFVTFHMPTMGVLSPNSMILLNAGAIIDLDLLVKEVNDLNVNPNRVYIHPNAAVITDEDRQTEKTGSSPQTKIASTQKGVGEALARKVARSGKVAKDYADFLRKNGFRIFDGDLNGFLEDGYAVMIETPQGMSLSLNNGFYPYCTSREVSVSQSLSDAGIHPVSLDNTLVTIRTFPIRVGNIYNESGEMVGWSGPVYPDQRELDWEKDFPGITPEKTTVTQRVRRIFTFSGAQYLEMIRRLRPTYVHVGFCDYLKSEEEFILFVERLCDIEMGSCRYTTSKVFSFGPSTLDVKSYAEAIKYFQQKGK